MTDLGTVADVEPKHRIQSTPERDGYACALCGPLRKARRGENARDPAGEHCREHNQCGSCWGEGAWIFPMSPIRKEPRCTKCDGAGTAKAELDPAIGGTRFRF
jgi:hypothetical protein